MAAPGGLPDPNTLDVFAYDDVNQDAMVNIVSADNTHARVIQDYVVDPVDCEYLEFYFAALTRILSTWGLALTIAKRCNTGQAGNRGNDRGDGTGPPNGVNTVEGILGFDTDVMECFVCNQNGNAVSIALPPPCLLQSHVINLKY